MIRPLRNFHFITWRLIALVLPVVFILAITLRPYIAKKVRNTGTSFLMEIRNASDSTSMLVITVVRPLEVPSCLVFATLKGGEILLGKLDHQGQYSYDIPGTDQPVTVRLYDPLKKKAIDSYNLNY